MDVKQFGEIKLMQRSNARGIRVTIRPDRITITYSPLHSLTEVRQFVVDNAAKILAKQEELKRQKATDRSVRLITPDVPLQTLTFRVEVRTVDVSRIHARFAEGLLRIDYPLELAIADAQPYFWKAITYYLRAEAKRVLPVRVAQLAAEHGFSYSAVKIQASKSRWGSCSTRRSINLSLYLMLAPQHLVDYVILHELCHTREMNHSPRFWTLMDQVTDGCAKAYRTELRKVQIP